MPIKTMGGVVKSFFAAVDKQDGNIDIANKMQQFTLDILGVTTFGKKRKQNKLGVFFSFFF